jgi:sulfofructose kinase
MTGVRVLGVGHVAQDHVFSVTSLPLLAVKTPAHHHVCNVGGMTANALVAAARLGARARMLAPVGDDAAASVFVDYLRREGVDPAGLQRVACACSSVSAVVVDALGERLIVNHRGDALLRAPALEPAILATWLAEADVLIADPRCPSWAAQALKAARERALLTVLDGDTAPRDDLLRLVPLADWAVFSEPGLAILADRASGAQATEALHQPLAHALALGAKVAVVTLGERGLLWQRTGQPVQRLGAFAVDAVLDTTAAGDVFHGALAVALAEGGNDRDALRFASAAAAMKCRQAGGVGGAPQRAELDDWLGSGREPTPFEA